jgi:hypothetical protein
VRQTSRFDGSTAVHSLSKSNQDASDPKGSVLAGVSKLLLLMCQRLIGNAMQGPFIRPANVFLNFILDKQGIERAQERAETVICVLPLLSVDCQVYCRQSSSDIPSTSEYVY